MRAWISTVMLVMAVGLAAACGGESETPAVTATATLAAIPTVDATATATVVPRFDLAPGALIVRAQGNYNFEIYRVNVDGSGLTNLTNHRTTDWSGAWSPDGNAIAFGSYRDGTGDIYVMRQDGTDVRNLTITPNQSEGLVSWSPDGTSLLFGFFTEATAEYWLMNADGSGRTMILPNCRDCGILDWSPDSSRLVGYQTDDDGSYLFTINRDGSDLRRIADIPFAHTRARWAPSGEKIAFTSRDSDSNEPAIWLVNEDGSGLRKLYVRSDIVGLSWAPDGQALAVTAFTDVLVVDADTGVSTTVAMGGRVYDVEWSPSGEHIAYISRRANTSGIYVVSASGGTPLNVSNGPWGETELQWSPDGQQLIFRSDRDSLDGIYAISPDGSEQERVIALPPGQLTPKEAEGLVLPEADGGCVEVFPSNPLYFQACLSPDGTSAVAIRIFENPRRSEVIIVDTATDERRVVPTHGYDPYGLPAWSPDGESLALYGRSDGESSVHVVDVNEGASRRVAPGDIAANPSQALLWSPDGTYLYFTKGSACQGGCSPGFLYRARADGSGEAEQLTDFRVVTVFGFAP